MTFLRLCIFFTLTSLLLFSASIFAQAQVVDRTSPGSQYRSSESQAQQASSGQLAELYYQVQVLQQEVMELRGQVEQQNHQLKQLKQQRLDDYVDLDRRLGEVSKSGPSSRQGKSANHIKPKAGSKDNALSASTQTNEASPADEIASYREAIDLVLKKKDYEKAASAFQTHLQSFPNGRYSANAKYWLGEIYLQNNNLDGAQEQFISLLDAYPEHSKALDAKFKLGKVYDLLGEKDKALGLLEEVAKSEGSTSSLAKEYIRKNFSS